jgi:hypothetical protein
MHPPPAKSTQEPPHDPTSSVFAPISHNPYLRWPFMIHFNCSRRKPSAMSGARIDKTSMTSWYRASLHLYSLRPPQGSIVPMEFPAFCRCAQCMLPAPHTHTGQTT